MLFGTSPRLHRRALDLFRQSAFFRTVGLPFEFARGFANDRRPLPRARGFQADILLFSSSATFLQVFCDCSLRLRSAALCNSLNFVLNLSTALPPGLRRSFFELPGGFRPIDVRASSKGGSCLAAKPRASAANLLAGAVPFTASKENTVFSRSVACAAFPIPFGVALRC